MAATATLPNVPLRFLTAELFMDERSGRVVCRAHAERPTDIDVWSPMTRTEVIQWASFLLAESPTRTNACEACEHYPMGIPFSEGTAL